MDEKQNQPLLKPEQELPAPHDMLLKDGKDHQSTSKLPLLKWLLPAFVSLLILLGGAWYMTQNQQVSRQPSIQPSPTPLPSPTPTPDMREYGRITEQGNVKTYTHLTLEISFSYPSAWDLEEDFSNDEFRLPRDINIRPNEKITTLSNMPGIDTSYKNSYFPRINLRYFENPKKLTLQQYEEEEKNSMIASSPDFYSPNNKQIKLSGGTLASYSITFGYDGGGGCDGGAYIIPYDKRIYVICSMSNSLNSSPIIPEKEQLKVLNQILSTFKFLGQDQAVDTSNWKKYMSNIYRFTLSYPQNFSYETVFDTPKDEYNHLKVQFKDHEKIVFSADITTIRPYSSGRDQYYLGASKSAQTSFNNIAWDIYISKSGYCDLGQCGDPFIVYKTPRNGKEFSLYFPGSSDRTALQSQILSSYKFIQ